MNEPASIPCFIAVQCADALPKESVKRWYACAGLHAPSGTIFSTTVSDETGLPRTVALVHRRDQDGHRYIIPLTRNLTAAESEAIITAFAEDQPALDFDATASSSVPAAMPRQENPITVDQQAFASLCDAWAKRQHEHWMRERTEMGWRYGTDMSLVSKTHPLLLPWEHLPAHYRRVDTEQPQGLLDLLNAQGYAVITKGELDALLTLARGNPR